MSMAGACEDLAEEAATLRSLAVGSDPEAVTPFFGWRVRDTIHHLVFIDRLAALSLTDPLGFAGAHRRFVEGTAPRSPGLPPEDIFARLKAYETSQLGALSWGGLLAAWETGLADLLAAAGATAADATVNWFGPPMRARTLIHARQMEVWGYGQDVFDLMRTRRREGERLHNVAAFGVRTLGFSFASRGLATPDPRPFVRLTSPSGLVWTWNDETAADSVEGPAADFCLVATQRRHLDDTRLTVTGEGARTWMRIAQCVAGPPVDGPHSGARA